MKPKRELPLAARRPWLARAGWCAPWRAFWRAGLLASCLLGGASAARAQYIETYFPPGVPGYEAAQGVTVLSRLRPLYEEPGVHVGDFIVRPMLEEGIGYDSNINGFSGGASSAFLRTAPAISANSLWSRDSLGLSLSADNYQYFSAPRQNYTNWTAAIGGGYTIGRSDLTVAYSHLSLNQNATDIGAVPSLTPVHYSVDDARVSYPFDLGRVKITPNVDLQYYAFNTAEIADQTTGLATTVSQTYRNRVVLTGGVTTQYGLSDQRNLLLVAEGVQSHYTEPAFGQPTYNSTSVLVLGGIDYAATGPWRYQVLIGVEERSFASAAFRTHVAPIAQAVVIWTPTGLTTVTGTLARLIEDPSAEGNSGYTYTTARLVVDHELKRNILLQARVAAQSANYLQGGGTQTSYTLGAGVNWLLNRHVRLSLDYDFTEQSGSTSAQFTNLPSGTALFNGPFNRQFVLLAVHLAL